MVRLGGVQRTSRPAVQANALLGEVSRVDARLARVPIGSGDRKRIVGREDELCEPGALYWRIHTQDRLPARGEKCCQIYVGGTILGAQCGTPSWRLKTSATTERRLRLRLIDAAVSSVRYDRPAVNPDRSHLTLHTYSLNVQPMRTARILPQDIWWRAARRAECFDPHEPKMMSSACSTPPIYSWVCGICASHQRTTRKHPPTCTGGYAFSFTTAPIDEPL
jgi:hypothetical protein